MNKKTWAYVLGLAGAFSYLFPTWNGILFEASQDSDAGKIIGVILIIGAVIIYYLPEKIKN
ncbi:MAG: hypothetical protein WC735_01995 [Candidatus Paceibacterota bacterium]|jgi:hypothetical protein